jgi:hypothetical protein
LDLVLKVVELGRTRGRERMKQDVGGFDGGPSGVEILGVGVFDDDLSAGGRITDLGMDPQHDQEWSGELLFRLMTYTSFTLGSLFVTSDGILLVGVHLVHHLFLLLLTLALLLSRDLPLAGSLFIRSRSFSSVSALAGVPIVSSPMVHMSSIGLYRTPGLLGSKTILFLPLLPNTDGFELSLILLCLLLVLNLLLPVSLNGGCGVIVGIP